MYVFVVVRTYARQSTLACAGYCEQIDARGRKESILKKKPGTNERTNERTNEPEMAGVVLARRARRVANGERVLRCKLEVGNALGHVRATVPGTHRQRKEGIENTPTTHHLFRKNGRETWTMYA